MVTKPKSNSVITHEVAGRTIRFNVLGAGSITLDLNQVSMVAQERALMHGFIQRIADAAALSRDPNTGLPATPQAKLESMQELVDHYNSGATEWSPKRTSGGASDGGLLVRALLECFPNKGVDRIREYVKGLKKGEQTALAESDTIKPIIDRMKAEAVKHVDTEALIAGL